MIVFSILVFLMLFAGAVIFTGAQSAIHEIEGFLCFVIAAMFSACALLASILAKLDRFNVGFLDFKKDIEKRATNAASVADERWEALASSLQKLDRVNKVALPPTEGEDFDPITDLAALAQPRILKVTCAKCGKTVKAKSDWSGRKGKCPGCGAEIHFPIVSGDQLTSTEVF